MQNLRGSDSRQIAIALMDDDDALRERTLQAGGDRRRASVRGLNVANIEIVIGEDRTADRAHQHRAVLNLKLVDGFGNQFMRNAVAASRTVVCLVLNLGFARVAGVE